MKHPELKIPEKFHALATYNTEVARGISHSDDYKATMGHLQREFNAWIRQRYTEAGYDVID